MQQDEDKSLLEAHSEEEKEKEVEKEVEKEKEKEKEPPQHQATHKEHKPASYARPPTETSSHHHKPQGQKATTTSGFMGWLTKVATEVTQELEVGLEKLSDTIDQEIHNRNLEGERHFQEEFRLPSTERLLGSYGCKVLNGDVGVAGTAYISENHFCFQGGALKILIPLQTILKIQKALRLREHQTTQSTERRVHTFQPVPPLGRGDCLQLYTNDHMIHHFFSDPFTFGPLHNVVLTFDSFFKIVDEAWKYANTPRRTEESPYYTPQPDSSYWGQQSGQQQQQQPPQQVQQQQQPQQPQQQPQQAWSPFPQSDVQVPSPQFQMPLPTFVPPVPQHPVIPQELLQPPPQQAQQQPPQQPPQQQQHTTPEDLSNLLASLGPTPQGAVPKNE